MPFPIRRLSLLTALLLMGLVQPFYPGTVKPAGSNYSRIVVVPKTKNENVDWISKELPGTEAAVYEIDDPSASRYRVPKSKGHEAMVYLSYIIDHYDDLPETIIFVHAHKATWHNNFLLNLDTPMMIKHLHDDRAMFPGHRPPLVLSQACCAQFAVSSERVRDNPKSVYEHLRNWLIKTPMEDKDSGRVFEYMWQYLFTRNAEFCPAMNSCYCDGYGICFGSAVKLDTAQEEKKDQAIFDEISERVQRLNRELNAEKDEAFRRGKEEANRAIERERASQYP
ncbi:hypothetical protein K491DRAFT_767604 [Lophiostoma macrostomum CBS 122681]|uniref:Uncharacterized protein n=1 Tax=Lophiostoma macrostomum CBS 122681 TaxID=1314788 RepID=A0A6A6TA68_9PLEO|nr:hypothetical protein K491DRAFT_767604 [Lophiostoma macrostomum CBS 122681]